MITPIIKSDDFEIWRIIETETEGCIPTDTFPKADTPSIVENKSWLYPHYIDASDNFIMATQSFVIKTRDSIILVDGGVGNGKVRYTPWANKLQSDFLANLKNSGFTHDSITAVLTTHFHMDHVGWYTCMKNGEWVPTFPNAQYYFVKSEYDYWKNNVNPKNLDNNIALLDSVEPVVLANKATFVPNNFHLTESIYLEPAPGHTPGQVLIHIESARKHVIIAGDVLHHPIQFNNPHWTADYYDVDTDQALNTRVDFINKYANTETVIIGHHFASHPAGLIKEKDGKRFFVPVVE